MLDYDKGYKEGYEVMLDYDKGYKEGYEEGRTKGLEDARKRIREELEAKLDRLNKEHGRIEAEIAVVSRLVVELEEAQKYFAVLAEGALECARRIRGEK